MIDWLELRMILEVYYGVKGKEGGGRCCETLWHKTVARKQLREMIADISAALRKRKWEYGRCCDVGEGG